MNSLNFIARTKNWNFGRTIKRNLAILVSLVLALIINEYCFSNTIQLKAKQITKSPASQMAGDESWITLINTPENPSQVEIGAEIYRLVCSTCHGDRGQGLTPDWLATMNPENRNCWQAKCHASNHPPDGFTLPHDIPALAGPDARPRFDTALEMYTFIRNFMPYQVPGTMLPEEYWAVTAFVLKLKGIQVEGELDPSVAGTIYILD